jgi:hypothetical protein
MKHRADHISTGSAMQMLSIALASLGGFAAGCAVHPADKGIFAPAIIAAIFGLIALFTSAWIGRCTRLTRISHQISDCFLLEG